MNKWHTINLYDQYRCIFLFLTYIFRVMLDLELSCFILNPQADILRSKVSETKHFAPLHNLKQMNSFQAVHFISWRTILKIIFRSSQMWHTCVSMCAHVYKDFTDKTAIFRTKLSFKRLLTLSMLQNNCLSILPLCSYPHYLHPEVMTSNIHPVSGRRPTFERFSFHLPMLQFEFCYSKYIPAARKGKKTEVNHEPLPLATKLPQLQGAKYFVLFHRLFSRQN